MNIKDFEAMLNMAELKVLSNISLERPLTDAEFNRITELENIILR
mgnify:FL=1